MTPEQAKALRESATNIIAHEKMLEAEQAKLVAELEKTRTSARQSVLMAEEATHSAGILREAATWASSMSIPLGYRNTVLGLTNPTS